MQRDDRLLTKIFERVSNELETMGAVSKKAFWQVADHFLGVKREKEIRVNPEFSRDGIREEARAEEVLKKSTGADVFEELTKQCIQKLYTYLGEEKRDLTPDLIKRVENQAEKAANFIFHAHTLRA
jgi:hypothetical protein